MTIVSPAEIIKVLNLTTTNDLVDDIQEDLTAIQDTLENILNRVLQRRTMTSTQTIWAGHTKVNLLGPVVKVLSITNEDGNPITWRRPSESWLRDQVIVNGAQSQDGQEVTIQYTAGSLDTYPTAEELIRNVCVRIRLAGINISSGLISGLSVEGTSVEYGEAVTGRAVTSRFSGQHVTIGPFSAIELSSVSKLHRLVTR